MPHEWHIKMATIHSFQCIVPRRRNCSVKGRVQQIACCVVIHRNSIFQFCPNTNVRHPKNPNSRPNTNIRETVSTLTYILHIHRTFCTCIVCLAHDICKELLWWEVFSMLKCQTFSKSTTVRAKTKAFWVHHWFFVTFAFPQLTITDYHCISCCLEQRASMWIAVGSLVVANITKSLHMIVYRLSMLAHMQSLSNTHFKRAVVCL